MDEVIQILASLPRDQAGFLKNQQGSESGGIQLPGLITYLPRVFKRGRKKETEGLIFFFFNSFSQGAKVVPADRDIPTASHILHNSYPRCLTVGAQKKVAGYMHAANVNFFHR